MMLFPASGDPLEKIPRVRLALWPLGPAASAALRTGSLALNPVFWVTAALLGFHAPAAITVSFVAVMLLWGRRSLLAVRLPHPWRGGLVTNNLRQMFSLLDTWLTLAIAAGGALWRLLAAHPDPAAFPILSMVAAMALSTCAQCLFALDGESGITRYRLLPLPGWRIVLAKDSAFLAVLLLAVLPLSLVPGLSFGMAALALGRYPSLHIRIPQERWRFTSGRVVWGASQGIVGAMLGFAGALGIAAVLYALSLWWAGRQWDRRIR
jgi:hypothetical protein